MIVRFVLHILKVCPVSRPSPSLAQFKVNRDITSRTATTDSLDSPSAPRRRDPLERTERYCERRPSWFAWGCIRNRTGRQTALTSVSEKTTSGENEAHRIGDVERFRSPDSSTRIHNTRRGLRSHPITTKLVRYNFENKGRRKMRRTFPFGAQSPSQSQQDALQPSLQAQSTP